MDQQYIVELNEQNFQQVLQSSLDTPVLIYFWASMTPESRDIIPELEKLAGSYAGALTLALLDCEQQQMLAGQFGIRALPTVALFVEGQAVGSLAGPQTMSSVNELLAPYLPSLDDIAFLQIQTLISNGEFSTALVELKQLEHALGETGPYKLALATCYVELQQFDVAETTLANVLMQDQNAIYKSLIAKIELHQQAADTPEIRELQLAHEADPSNTTLSYELAIKLSQVSRQEEALELLMALLRQDLNIADGDAKKAMMDILAAMGQGNELASRYRRQLYSLLY